MFDNNKNMVEIALLKMHEKQLFQCDYVDLLLDENAFNKMEILLGPRTDDSDLYIVESLLKNYLPPKYIDDITIKKSKLNIKGKA